MLEVLRKCTKYKELLVVRAEQRAEHIDIDFWAPHCEAMRNLFQTLCGPFYSEFGDTVSVSAEYVREADREALQAIIRNLLPWRKGPFRLLDIEIDSEWRSNLKWDRIAPHLGSLTGKKIADVGCNNGYYMFRMLSQNPELVLGLDPNGRFCYQFDLLNRLIGAKNCAFEPLGIEHMHLFEGFFDIVLCLGVIYHRRDPVDALASLRTSLRTKGRAIVESITVPGNDAYVLHPKDRYAMMRNVWAIPSEGCLVSWMKDAGFSDIRIVSSVKTESYEQRKTALAPYDSLDDFLDPNDSSRTVEGYPAPVRTIVVGTC